MGEVAPARTSLTLHPPSPSTVHQLSRLALLRVKRTLHDVLIAQLCIACGYIIAFMFLAITRNFLPIIGIAWYRLRVNGDD